jgi:gas vesicle protein
MKKSGKVLLGVLAGVAVGAILGILFAPDKGVKTRKKISKKGEDYAEALKEKFNEFLESISEGFEMVSEDASEIGDQAIGESEDVKNIVKPDSV